MKFIFLFILAYSASAFSQANDLLVDFEYSCSKYVKKGESQSYESLEEYGTDFQLKVGLRKSEGFFGVGAGGPWMSLEDLTTNDIMVFGVENCLKNKYQSSVSIHLDCVDKFYSTDIGFGYYYGSSSKWVGYNRVGKLPGLHNWNLSMSSGFWQGETSGLITTATLAGYDADTKNITLSRFECQRTN